MKTTSTSYILMLGPDPNSQGGIASVIKTYQEAHLFQRWPMVFLPTTVSPAPLWKKAWVGFHTLMQTGFRILKGEVALIHIHTASWKSFYRKTVFLALARTCKVPTLLHIHACDFDRFCADSPSMVKKLIQWVLNHASGIIVLSHQWEAVIQPMTNNTNIFIVHNPIILPEVAPDSGRNPHQWLFLGPLGHRKGFYDLVKATQKVVSDYPDMKVYCGGPVDSQEITDAIEASGLEETMILPGWLDPSQRQALMDCSCYYILPTYKDAMPMSILESMASGLPVISTYVGSIPEMITDGVEGFLVSSGDLTAIADRMKRLMASDTLRKEMSAAGLKKVQAFTPESAFKKLDAIYAKLMALKPSSSD